MGSRRNSRVYALQILYVLDICKLTEDEAFRMVWQDALPDDKVKEFCVTLASGTLKNRDFIDTLIIKYAENWELKRMAVIDRNILRLASFELIYQESTPISVIIDEAVEIAKEFSTNDSGKFVNGILDKIKHERKESVANDPPSARDTHEQTPAAG